MPPTPLEESTSVSTCEHSQLVPVFQTSDSNFHWINHYPVDKY